MAETLRHRLRVPDAPCDDRLEPVALAWRRATMRSAWRETYRKRAPEPSGIERFVGASSALNRLLEQAHQMTTFGESWLFLEANLVALARICVASHHLPLEIQRASELLASAREAREPGCEPLERFA